MDKLYYEVDFCRCKTSTEKTMLRKLAKDGDCIEWYNDGKNIFFGDCVMYLMLPFISFFIFFDKEMGVFRTSVKNITLLLCVDKHFELEVKVDKGNIYIMI